MEKVKKIRQLEVNGKRTRILKKTKMWVIFLKNSSHFKYVSYICIIT